MADSKDYVPPRVWTRDEPSGGAFANINRPVAGATHERDLPVGKHPLQLYSLATPNGQKVSIMLEELLERGHADADYDAWPIRIGDGDFALKTQDKLRLVDEDDELASVRDDAI